MRHDPPHPGWAIADGCIGPEAARHGGEPHPASSPCGTGAAAGRNARDLAPRRSVREACPALLRPVTHGIIGPECIVEDLRNRRGPSIRSRLGVLVEGVVAGDVF